jgi:hypothetical protein
MGSLRNCLGKAKKFISKEDADDILASYQDYLDHGFKVHSAARRAVKDAIGRAMEDRADIVKQIKTAGGVAPAESETPKRKEAEKAQEPESEKKETAAETKEPAPEPGSAEPTRESFIQEMKTSGESSKDGKRYRVVARANREDGWFLKVTEKGFTTSTVPGGPKEAWSREYAIERAAEEAFGTAEAQSVPEPERAEPTRGRKPAKWFESLDEDQRNAVFAEMRRLDERAEANLEKSRDLTPRHGEVAVGGAHMDYFIPGEAIAQFLRLLRRGNSPDVAAKGAKEYAREIVAKWNKQRGGDYQTHRWEGSADNLIEDAERSIRNAFETISEKEKPSSHLPELMTRDALEELATRVASMSDAEKKQVGQWINDQFDRLERDGKRIEKHCLSAGKKFSIK